MEYSKRLRNSKRMINIKKVVPCHNLNYKTTRSGIIPYTIDPDKKLWFLLAQHRQTKELGDFGGGVKKNENAIKGARREFFEESNGIYEIDNIENSHAIVDSKKTSAIIFYKIPYEYKNAVENFKGNDEVSKVFWVNCDDFCSLVRHGGIIFKQEEKFKLWDKIRTHIRFNIDELCNILN